MAPLTEIAEIELLGSKFKLGKNGKVSLVSESLDVWGKIRGDEVTLTEWLGATIQPDQEEKIQALLDQLGDALSRLRQSRDSKLGVGQQKGE